MGFEWNIKRKMMRLISNFIEIHLIELSEIRYLITMHVDSMKKENEFQMKTNVREREQTERKETFSI